MLILFVSSWFPYPPDNGSRARTFNLLRQLAKRHEVTLVSFNTTSSVSENSIDVLRQFCVDVRIVEDTPFQPRRSRALLGFLSSKPRYLVDTFSQEMSSLVDELRSSIGADWIIASQLKAARHVVGVKGVPKIFEEAEITVFKERYRQESGNLSKFRYLLTWWKFARYFNALSRHFHAVTVVSEREGDLVRRLAPQQAIHVIPNGVDLEYYSQNFGPPRPDLLVYSGAVTYFANLDAVSYFVDAILPLIHATNLNVELRVTGSTDQVAVDTLVTSDKVCFTGYLPDIRPTLAASAVCVVPLRIGGGTRTKILEAMALGVPVVSTSKGAEGLDVAHGDQLLIADEPRAFADCVLRLLAEEGLRERLRANGRQFVETAHAWDTIGSAFLEILRTVA